MQKVDLPAPAGPFERSVSRNGGQIVGKGGRYHNQGAILAHCRSRDGLMVTRVMRLVETSRRARRDTFLP